ncbi:MAG: SurA N-terminal domain-containing protein [Deltaproteobacteria bacterium]|nr:SurA N-terminal domain-containing protein [Deltaproteobacteria bacterium]
MLTYLRRHSRSWLAYTVFGAIIVVFILWGGSSYLTREANKIAKIDRYIISAEQFSKAYTDALRVYQERFGQALTPEMVKRLDLKNTVLDQMIDEYIIEVDAKDMGIQVTDEDLQQAIQQVPAFMENGKFSMPLYRRYLEYERLTPPEFESRQRKSLLKQRFLAVLAENVIVPRQEVEATFHFVKDTYDLSFIGIDPLPFAKDIQVSQGQVQKYYDANKERYKVLPKITLAYIDFPAARYVGSVEVTKDEARDYYESHKSEFGTPAKIHARQILIKVPEGADSKALEAKGELAKKIAAYIGAGQDFASLAVKYSEDEQTAGKGGDMGNVTRDSMPQGLAGVFDSMKPGEVKGPIRSPLGFHILKLEGKEGGDAAPFEQVSSTVMETLKFQRAKYMAKDEANTAFTELYEQLKLDFEGYAKKKGLAVKVLGPLSEGDNFGVQGSQEIIKKAFTFSPGEIGEVVDAGGGFIVYMVTRKEASRIPALKEVSDRITADIRKSLAQEKAKEYAGKLASSSPGQLLAQNPSSTGEFSRTMDAVPKLSTIPMLKDDLDSLHKPKVYQGKDMVYVVWLKSRKMADIKTMNKEQEQAIMKELFSRKQQMIVDSYLEQARKKHKITIEKDRMAEGRGGSQDVPAPSDYN